MFSTSTLKFFKCKRPANFAQGKIEDWKQNWSPMLGTMINNHVVPQSFWSKVNKLKTSPTLPEIGCTQTQIHPTNLRCVASRAQRCVSCFSQSQNLSFLTSNALETFPPPSGFQMPVRKDGSLGTSWSRKWFLYVSVVTMGWFSTSKYMVAMGWL